MLRATPIEGALQSRTSAFFRSALRVLEGSGVPFLIGGAYALERYTGVERHTKDLDIFLRRADLDAALAAFGAAGFETDLAFPHWLAKARCGDDYVDLIFSSGNAVAAVDDATFARAVDAEVLARPLKLCAPEDILWSKAFIMERERYDGADVAHLLRACAERLDWPLLLELFGENWRVLYSHLILFGFIYPAERGRIPDWVMVELANRLDGELGAPAPGSRVCRGTLLSRAQYLIDVGERGYTDGRLRPHGNMTQEQVAIWTADIAEGQP
jgi:hypothetical protein